MRRVRSSALQPVSRLSAVPGHWVALLSRGPRLARLALLSLAFVALGAAPASAAKYVDRVIGTQASGSTGGLFSAPDEIAVNHTGAGGVAAGTFYVADRVNQRIQRFAPSGTFERAWGADVDLPAGGTDLELCAVASSCKQGAASSGNGTAAGNGTFAFPGAAAGVAVDDDTGHVYVSDFGVSRVSVFTADGGFLRSFGFDVVASGPGNTGTGYEICVAADGDVCKAGIVGSGVGQLAGSVAGAGDLVVSPSDGNGASGKLYLANASARRIEVYDLDGTTPATIGSATNFGNLRPRDLAIGAGVLYAADSANSNEVDRYDIGSAQFVSSLAVSTIVPDATQASVGLDVDPGSGNLLVARSSSTAGVLEFANPGGAATFVDRHLTTVTPLGVAAGPASGELAEIIANRILILNPGPTAANVTISGATEVEANGATLNGTIDSSGGLATNYQLQHSDDGVVWTTVASGTVPAGATEAVSGVATDLRPNTLYRVRVLANRSFGNPDMPSSEVTFVTDALPAAAPVVSDQVPAWVDRTNATLRAEINPIGLNTAYHFELGTDTSYGKRIPAENELFLGSGSDPVTVTASPTGLDPATKYYFRVVATNAEGTTRGPDQPFETLNEDHLAEGRHFELVSPADKGPVGTAGIGTGIIQQLFAQASSDGTGLAYLMAWGTPDATSGGELAYKATRNNSGWESTQLSPSSVGLPLTQSQSSTSSHELYIAPDLGCGFLQSALRLTDDAAGDLALDSGAFNLYRRDVDGGYDLVPNMTPTNLVDPWPGPPITDNWNVHAATPDCRRVVFSAPFRYPGVDFSGGTTQRSGLYLWDEGQLSNLGVIPGPSGPEIAAPAKLGAPPGGGTAAAKNSAQNAVSTDLSRVFFTTVSKLGADSGRLAVFMREDATTTVDVSQSQTATVNNDDSRYQIATPSGSHVFFTGRYGLAANGSSSGPASCNEADGAGCDLYRYSSATGALVDVSVDSNSADSGGAGVFGVVDLSADGSRVYFLARGQLVPGEGNTEAENLAEDTYSLYLWDSGVLSHVATLGGSDFGLAGLANPVGLLVSHEVEHVAGAWSAQATPSGGHLVFQSGANLTGDNSSAQYEAYLYSADSGQVVCVSCRRDGLPPNPAARKPLPAGGDVGTTGGAWPRPRIISDDGRWVFFYKSDPLAPGAAAGDDHGLFAWHDGQITLLAASDVGDRDPGSRAAKFGAATNDMGSVFFSTPQSLVSRDTDGRQDFYVARIGGGFPAPEDPPAGCDPLGEGSCQGAGSGRIGPVVGTRSGGGDGDFVAGVRGEVRVERPSAAQMSRLGAGRRVNLVVSVNRAGGVTVKGAARVRGKVRRVLASSRRAHRAGAVKIPIRLAAAGRKALARAGALRVSLTVRLAQAEEATTRVLTLTLERPAARRTAKPKRGGAS
jgi:NHL repeat